MFNKEQIKQIIPHRHPFLLIDEITDLIPGKVAVGKKHVKIDEYYFQGHFPQEPVMPGVLIIEALAQTGAVALLSMPEFKGKIAYFGGIKKARFKDKVMPGDTLELSTELTSMKGRVGIGKGIAKVNGKIVATAELTFAVGE
ncbi:3-hydroxyacyl-ACP dehydratase FabZ [Clostridium sp. 'deep sea']|uniref:3-hydroxyacyl-ACP dehydratase FabZ n=1 Tax=Clostridium sp. 'deep sea' TaxID=2779445 RepID=UPI0018969CA3|nr:3-hydroxyacyl-ACP dehydratase FabZ [Clostridium sp. 'deep sea']QOR34631.1 3-hydroxyacyl-ACP dehydratase FabZ [Clostridium sp. 'deep sea']